MGSAGGERAEHRLAAIITADVTGNFSKQWRDTKARRLACGF